MPRLSLAKLAGSFPARAFPDGLQQLAVFQDESQSYAYAGEFIIDNTASRFLDDIPHADSFAAFGKDSTGSVFCCWSGSVAALTDAKLNTCPIVYLSSEAVYSTVVARSFRHFLQLLLVASDDFGTRVANGGDFDVIAPSDEATAFREWAAETLDLTVPCDPIQLVHDAKLEHQDAFFDWYRKWQKSEPWTTRVEE